MHCDFKNLRHLLEVKDMKNCHKSVLEQIQRNFLWYLWISGRAILKELSLLQDTFEVYVLKSNDDDGNDDDNCISQSLRALCQVHKWFHIT